MTDSPQGIAAMQKQQREPKPLEERAGHSLRVVRAIAVFKFIKATLLLVVGLVLLRMLHGNHSVHDALKDFVNDLRLDENNEFIHGWLQKALGVSVGKLRLFGVGTLIYSGLYLTEGVGLWFDKGWAEWMTVITTAGFLPLEIMEIFKEPTLLRVGIFLINVLLLVYIILRIWWRHEAKKAGVKLHRGRPVTPVGAAEELR